MGTATETRDQGKNPVVLYLRRDELNLWMLMFARTYRFSFFLSTDTTIPTCGDSTVPLPPHPAFPPGVSHNAPEGADMCLSPPTPEPNQRPSLTRTQALSVSLVTISHYNIAVHNLLLK